MQSIIPKGIRPAYPDAIPAAAVRSKLVELLGLEEIPAEIDYTTEGRQEAGDLCTMRVSYENSLGETVPGILMVPREESARKRPGIVCVPGTGGAAEEIADSRFYLEQRLMGWACELARRGFATLAISPKGCEVRRSSLEDWATENKLLAPYGRTQMGVLVEETLKGARLLAATPGVDPNRIGLTGNVAGWQCDLVRDGVRSVDLGRGAHLRRGGQHGAGNPPHRRRPPQRLLFYPSSTAPFRSRRNRRGLYAAAPLYDDRSDPG